MIAACYTMDVYCDNSSVGRFIGHSCATGETCTSGVAQFAGETYADCAKQARKAGWFIGADKQTAYCPRCKNDRKT